MKFVFHFPPLSFLLKFFFFFLFFIRSVEIFSSPHLKCLCSINLFNKIVNCISWHPLYTMGSDKISTCSNWLALGSNDAFIPIIDLSGLHRGKFFWIYLIFRMLLLKKRKIRVMYLPNLFTTNRK